MITRSFAADYKLQQLTDLFNCALGSHKWLASIVAMRVLAGYPSVGEIAHVLTLNRECLRRGSCVNQSS